MRKTIVTKALQRKRALRSTFENDVSVILPVQVLIEIPPARQLLRWAAPAGACVNDSLGLADVRPDANDPSIAKKGVDVTPQQYNDFTLFTRNARCNCSWARRHRARCNPWRRSEDVR